MRRGWWTPNLKLSELTKDCFLHLAFTEYVSQETIQRLYFNKSGETILPLRILYEEKNIFSKSLKFLKMDKKVSYVCDLCKKNLSSRQTRHKMYCRVSSLESSFLCAECSTPFSMGYEVTDREQSSYASEEFDKVFYSKMGLKYHSYEHSNAWPYQCKQCGKGFGFKSSLKRHMLTHSVERHYICDICHSTFKLKQHLDQHLNIHDEQNPFICEQCDKICYSKSNLKSHMTVHSEERPFECNICHATFKRKSQLKCHKKKHVEDSD